MIIKFFPKFENIDPPIVARSAIPQWYKNQPGYNEINHPTVKRCMPIFDAMTSGYILTSPSDILVDSTNPDTLVIHASDDFNGELISDHLLSQYDRYPIPENYHKTLLRIHPMWAVQTPTGYSSLFINPIHGGSDKLFAVAGLIDTDNFISDGHLSFFVKDNTQFEIKAGTPLIQIIPIKRDDWQMSLGTNEEMRNIVQRQNEAGIWVDGEHKFGTYKNAFHVPKNFK